jgi:hypothetical protein
MLCPHSKWTIIKQNLRLSGINAIQLQLMFTSAWLEEMPYLCALLHHGN